MKFYQIDKFFTLVSIGLIKIYQKTLSPDKGIFSYRLKGTVCVHEPHCSQYSINAFQRYGFIKGLRKTMDRVSRCTPASQTKYDPDHYRVIFFSSAPIGVPFLEKLASDPRFELVGVVTQPDKPAGRGLHLQPNIIKTTAQKIGLPEEKIFTPEKINPDKSPEGKIFYENIKKQNADFFVVIAYGKIIPQSVLDIPRIAPINVHGSILPEYRGASPIQSVLLDEKTETGITIMAMDATLDTGDIISILKFPLSLSDTSREIISAIQSKGPDFLADSLEEFAKGHLIRKAQEESKATFCTKIEKEDG
ncbi:MAG TPA: membrane protein insertion efficiency factor YidD, partial [Candidatus Absconditabacterales bacterium]|nr:membrane protein insertion efficiency factor YidD [Candidatus Absconditabacterales bacterium]